MSRPNPSVLFIILATFLVVLGGVGLLKGGLYIGTHEGDTLHMMEIVFRMADGQRPHLDFTTPVGGLAFAPIALFLTAGFGIGHSFVLAQVLVSVVLLPAIWWVALGRLTPVLAGAFACVVMVLVLALVHGESAPTVSVSMHYNRWAWAVAFVALLTAMVPPVHPKSPVVDGLVVGVMLSAMAMIKVTYFAAFIGPIVIGLLLTGQRRALVFAGLTGAAIFVALTLWLGTDYWHAYAGDLLSVARSDIRPNPGASLNTVLAAPAYLGGSLTAIMAVILLRQARQMTIGLVLLVTLPAFFYVTYQNFGNDPQWLMLLAVLLFAYRPQSDIHNPAGWNLRQGILVCGVAAVAFSAPSFINLAYSPFRHLRTAEAEFTPMLPRGGVNADLFTANTRALMVNSVVPQDGLDSGYGADPEGIDRPALDSFMGTTFAACGLESGLVRYFDTVSRDLEDQGYGGARIFAADLFSSFWLFGDFDPLVNGSPWNYGGLPGYDSADFLLVPMCPIAAKIRTQALKLIEERGTEALTEVRRTSIYVLYEIGRT